MDGNETRGASGATFQGHDRGGLRRRPVDLRARRSLRRPRRRPRTQERTHPVRRARPIRRCASGFPRRERHRLRSPRRRTDLERTHMTYHVPRGGLPPQTALTTDRTVFTDAYAVLTARTMSDITESYLPHWHETRLWVLARPLSGFAETFAQYLVEIAPGGGSDAPEPDDGAEGVIFVVGGELDLTLDGTPHTLTPGGYVFLAPGATWTLHNRSGEVASFHWIRKRYQRVDGIEVPESFVTNAADVEPAPMPDTDGVWATQRFVDPKDV